MDYINEIDEKKNKEGIEEYKYNVNNMKYIGENKNRIKEIKREKEENINNVESKLENRKFFTYFKEKREAEIWRDLINGGVNYKNRKEWGKKHHFIFLNVGFWSRFDEEINECFREIEKQKELVYYILTYYKSKTIIKEKEYLYITVMYLYFEPQYRLPIKYLKEWIYLDKINYRNLDDIIIGNYANKKIDSIGIRILNKEKLKITEDELITKYRKKAEEIHENPPKIAILMPYDQISKQDIKII